jgi:O-antigen ligase
MKLFKFDIIFFHFLTLLIVLLPGFLITGPFLPDFTVSIISIFFIIYCIKKKKYKYFNNFFFKIFIFFYLWIVICSLLSNNILFSLETSIFYVRFAIFSLAIFFFLEKDKKLLIKLFFSTAIFFLILIFDSLFQYFNNFNILGWALSDDGRVSSFFGKELILGSYFSRLLPFFFGLYFININFFKKNKILNYFFFIILLLSVFCIFISAERSSIFFFFISFFPLMFLLSKNRLIVFFAIIIMLLFFLISYIYQNKTYHRLVNHTASQLENSKLEKKLNIFDYAPVAYRDLYNTAFNMFVNNKFSGIGPKVFRVECKNNKYNAGLSSCNTHPHHTYLQLLAETGLVGFLTIFIIFLFLIYNFMKHLFFKMKNKMLFSDSQLCFFSMILITLSPLNPSGNFFGNWLNVIYYLPVGFILYNLNKKNRLKY